MKPHYLKSNSELLTAAILRTKIIAFIPEDPAPTIGYIDKYTDYAVRIRSEDDSAVYYVRNLAEILPAKLIAVRILNVL